MSRLVTLTGTGGVGKTRLALQTARELADSFADGVWLAELGLVRDPQLLAATVAESLRIADQTTRPLSDVVVEHLAGERELLLILDGGEHMVDECAALCAAVLDAAPGVRLLVTSRRPLGLAREHAITVQPLPRDESLALFADRAAAADPRFTVTQNNEAEVARLCQRLDGLPLAIELAAARLRTLSAGQIADRLDDRFRLLADGDGTTALPRHQTMRTTIGWSHELCEPRERLMWARLSVFGGDFSLDTARQVCADEQLPGHLVASCVRGLVSRSVLDEEITPAGPRFRMLDTVRDYGAEWLTRMDETARLGIRHRDFYLRFAKAGECEWFGAGQERTFRRTQAEQANLRRALEFCQSTPGQARAGLDLAATLWFYWVGCGHLAEGRQWLDRALAQATEPSRPRVKALWVNGYIADLQGDYTAAVGMLEECKDQAVVVGDGRTRLRDPPDRLRRAASGRPRPRRGPVHRRAHPLPGAGRTKQQRDHVPGGARDGDRLPG